jgi:hypothetical protein
MIVRSGSLNWLIISPTLNPMSLTPNRAHRPSGNMAIL